MDWAAKRNKEAVAQHYQILSLLPMLAMVPDDFNHQLAIKLSRALNIINPNDLLAQRVTDIAKTSTLDEFLNGTR